MTYAMKVRDLLRQGREEGIRALVITLKGLALTPNLIIQKLIEQFGLSPEDAEAKMKQYWEK